MGPGFSEPSGHEFEPRQVQIDTLALDLVLGDGERVGPGPQRVVGAQWFDSVVGLRYIHGQREVLRVQLERLAVKLERLVEYLLLGDAVEFPRVLAEETGAAGNCMFCGAQLSVTFVDLVDLIVVNEVEGARFGVNIIPHTAKVTSFGRLKPGGKVNLEIDLLARYVARLAKG